MADEPEPLRVKAIDLAKLSDDAVDLVSRGVDAKGRFGLWPEWAVDVAALTRGLAMSETTVERLRSAILNPDQAKKDLAIIVAKVADDAARRARADQAAEASVLQAIMKSDGRIDHTTCARVPPCDMQPFNFQSIWKA